CVCLRCREARGRTVDLQNAELVVREYDASGGKEIFLSFESPDRSVLYAFLRLRFHSYALGGTKHFIPSLQDAALIREVHTYGELQPVSAGVEGAGAAAGRMPPPRSCEAWSGCLPAGRQGRVPAVAPASSPIQHTGFGKRLIAEAERRAREAGFTKLAVISGVGVREYYRKLGYSLENEYMVKTL
ncbi:MAG: GNAT family N-acetyltransferase, partial [Candidatus Kerfeldbacteria bacterium]|nr:GNAT family N-acetyltransferase [Candidatus Kerfeldbacteria bacterium]